jgi:hypothetical protein
MGNTILTPSMLAKETLMRLKNNLVFGSLINKGYSADFVKGVGDTVTIPIPATFVAQTYNGSSLVYQNITQGSTTIQLTDILDVSFKVTSKELSLDISNFGDLYLEGVTDAFAQAIDSKLAELVIDVPYFVNVSGTPAMADIIALDRVLNVNKAPLSDRYLVMDPVTQAKYVGLADFVNAEKAGLTDTLRQANLGKLFTLDTYMDQNIASQVKGTLDAGATGTALLGAVTITIAAGGVSTTVKKGDIVTLADTLGQYVATELLTVSAGGAGTLKIYPAMAQAASGKTVTVHASGVGNVAFNKNAFALAFATLEAPIDGRNASVIRDPSTGIALRVVYGYDMEAKSNVVSVDTLIGTKTLQPDFAVRLIG